MDVHGALNYRVWRVGVHHVKDRMNFLIALNPQGATLFFVLVFTKTFGSGTFKVDSLPSFLALPYS